MIQQNRIFIFSICLAVAISFVACTRINLYQDLSEEDANEIVVILSEHGIKADKKREIVQNVASYTIRVKENDLPLARSLLLKHSLPRRKELGLTGVYKEKGLIPTPDEQKARFLLALKGEIINSLERLPEILDADVVLNMPTKDEFASAEEQHRQRPTASVVIRALAMAEGSEAVNEAKMQQFVANAIEGLNPRDVSVIISFVVVGEKPLKPGDVRSLPSAVTPAMSQAGAEKALPTEHKLAGLNLDESSKGRLKIYILIYFCILVVISCALIVVIVQGSRTRRQLAAMKGPAGGPAIEGQVLEDAPKGLPRGP